MAEPEMLSATQMAEDWRQDQNPPMPPHRHESDAAIPRKRDRQGWLIFALLFAAGIGSGIYLGTNHSWDGLSEHDMESMQSSRQAPTPAQDRSLAAAPPSTGSATPPSTASPASSGGMASSGSSESSAAAGAPPGSLGTPDDSQASLNRLRSEIDLWKSASKNNEISGYERYLREYPQGLYAAIAKLRLERLHAAAVPRSVEPQAESAKPQVKAAGLNAKPTAPQARVAEAAKPEPAAPPALKIRPEEAAWDKATSVDTAASYQEYLHKYPRGGYAALARDRLASMKLAANRQLSVPAQPEVRLPAESPISSGAGASSTASAGAPKSAATTAPPSSLVPPAPATPPAAAASRPAAASSQATAQESPPQAAPASPREAPDTQEQAATPTPPTPADNSVMGKAAPQLPPQASLKSKDSEPAGESSSAAPGRAIKFADQTMTGDFTVDKKTGLVSGKGKISWSNGNQFEGTLVQGSKEGKGKFAWNSGQRYNGDWAHDAPNGKGVFIFPDGSRYEGDVKDGFPHGQGTTRFKNGVVYNGDWVRGKIHGHGRYIWADGSYWEGEFRNDKKTENGKMYYPNKSAPGVGSASPPSNQSEPQRAAAASAGKESEEK